ncbi:DUF1127 domain-containing protein [Roseomonas xinghualingensis]|uniref:DUF1127 domain-containing protein n=1 Tax=Roseomonas xinghualingensis TaxID=2986475 RepID=UPI0021F0B5A4|nr:DUF1127 domain-containing protein [Roseomonas sp. SXEYE001]MCV4207584.1 DUF1127 domain-containing protein [Roseomonas sp. SXEYE001]
MSDHAIHHGTRGACVREPASATPYVPAAGWLAMIARIFRTFEERRILSSLDDRMLSDIGLNRLEAEREFARAPWDIEPRS